MMPSADYCSTFVTKFWQSVAFSLITYIFKESYSVIVKRMETIPFLVNLLDDDEDVKGIFSTDTDIVLRDLPTELLKKNLSTVCQGIAAMLSDVQKIGQFRLKEITVQVEVNAEGGIELVGTAKLGGQGAITLTFSE